MKRCGDQIFKNEKLAPFWLVVRLYVGWEWVSAGWVKVMSPLWFGADAGAPLQGFIQGALAKTAGPHPDVSLWYAAFLEHIVLPHSWLWSHFVACGELLVGLGLLLGALTGVAAFFGVFMNLNYLLAGTVSVNPTLLVLGIFLILARTVAGHIGVDRFLPPHVTRYWQ